MKNLTTPQTSEESETVITPFTRIIIAIFTVIPAFINICILILGIKTLKKKFHNLLVLNLCIGDIILSFSLTLFSLVKFDYETATNVNLCRFQTFTVAYGLIFTYSIVFLICYERYLVVKNYNFGVQDFFERFRFVIIGGTLSLGFMFTIETVLFVPHVKNISKCTLPQLYGGHYKFFIELFGIFLTSIMAGVIICCIRTSMLIFKLFFKQSKVQPATVTESETINEVNNQMELVPFESGNNFDSVICHDDKSERNDVEDDCITEISKTVTYVNRKSKDSPTNIRQLIAQMKTDSEREETKHSHVNTTTLTRNIKKKSDVWEIRAFITSGIIAASTIFLTGPFIVSYWIEYFYGEAFISTKIKLNLLVPLMLNSIMNPFIYAWRIPEIKQAVKKMLICCKKL